MATHVWQTGVHPAPSRPFLPAWSSPRVEAAFCDVGRLIFGGFFFYSGIHHLVDLRTLAAFTAAQGVPFPELAVAGTGLLLIAGSLCLLTRWPRAGAAMIMLFLLGVTPVMHAFWNDPEGPQRVANLGNFTKNLALFGATCIFAAMPGPWPTLFSRHFESRDMQAG